MELGTALYQIMKTLALPPASPLILAAVGIAMMRRWPARARIVLCAAWLLVFALSTPLVSAWLQAAVGTERPVDLAQLKSAQAIVILGGGLRLGAPEYGGDTLGILTLERTRYGARLARLTGLPVLVTGGRPLLATRSEAEVMRDALEQEFGVPVRWVETASRDTRDNARNSAAILLPLQITRVALVMHGFDVKRAVAEFSAAGFEVTAAPTQVTRARLEWVGDVLPQAPALLGSYYALYELAGSIVRGMR
jgi:uncharacterized SAM-binding protein YcdF (DUF218 family)